MYSPSSFRISSSGSPARRSSTARVITSAIRTSALSRATSNGSARVGSIPSTSSATANWATLSSPSAGRTCETYSMKVRFGPTTSTRLRALRSRSV